MELRRMTRNPGSRRWKGPSRTGPLRKTYAMYTSSCRTPRGFGSRTRSRLLQHGTYCEQLSKDLPASSLKKRAEAPIKGLVHLSNENPAICTK